MARQLTAKQNKFIDGVVSGLSQSEAYRRAYDAENMSVETIAVKASNMAAQDNIRVIIEQKKKELADKAIWSREQALSMLRDIAAEARKNATEVIVAGQGVEIEKYNAAAQNVAIKAIEQANKMCGYNEPGRQDITLSGVIRVELTDVADD